MLDGDEDAREILRTFSEREREMFDDEISKTESENIFILTKWKTLKPERKKLFKLNSVLLGPYL